MTSFLAIAIAFLFQDVSAQSQSEKKDDGVHAEFKMTTLQNVQEFDAHELFKEMTPFWDSDTIRIRLVFQPDPEEAKRLNLSGDKNYISLTVTDHQDTIAEEVMAAKNGILNLITNINK